MGAALPGSAALPHAVAEGRGRRALVTGIGGFTGPYVARELAAAGYFVVGTTHTGATAGPTAGATAGASRLLPPAVHEGIETWPLDLCDRGAVGALVEQVQADVVVHLAGLSSVPQREPEALYRVNLLGTRNLLAALAAQRRTPSIVLLASSATVYGNACGDTTRRAPDAGPADGRPAITEQVHPVPTSDYAASKYAMEVMARLWNDRLPIVVARPFNYTGVGQSGDFLLPKIVSHFRQGRRVIELGNVDVARDFSDVRVVAACYRRLLAAAPAGDCFNICSGRAHSLAEILACMAEIAGYVIDVRSNPALVRSGDVRVLVGSNARLQEVIGDVNQIALAATLCWMFRA